MNEEKKEQQINDEKISNAFGNEQNQEKVVENEADPKAEEKQDNAETKQEGAVSASKNKEQSERTYTQAEVDAMMTKARKKYTNKANGQELNKENPLENEEPKAEEQNIEQPNQALDLSTGITIERLAQAELKAQMAISGIDPSKVQRAVRLIDVNEVLENGQFSEPKAIEAVNLLLQEWPELKKAKDEQQNVFSFGAPDQQEQQKEEQKGMFSKIFGNQ
ncbi:MAG: hypothetical protein HFF01_00850 [Erysipelotrichaceae bacterium]|nr:hypothetical protein [Erysipelotrichaceae bacterium]